MAKGFKDYLAAANAVVTTLDVSEASRLIDDPDVTFVDVRDGNELAASGKLPGATHASRGLLEFKLDPTSPMHDKALASGKRLIFYCGTGGRSALAAKLAMDMGIENVAHMAGGIKAWAEADQRLVPADVD